MTREQAIKLYESGWWEPLGHPERAMFQMFEPLLCMPFAVFHEAVEKTLGRPVFTHEFAYPDSLRQEMLGERKAPTLDEIIALIPEDKRVIVIAGEGA